MSADETPVVDTPEADTPADDAPADETAAGQPSDQSARQWPQIEQELFATINEERTDVGMQPVVWDDLAAQAALTHAQDMAREQYLAHWDKDGKLPQQRYGEIGGRNYIAENVSCSHRIWDNPPAEIPEYSEDEVREKTARQHDAMFNEAAPNDGHRQNILNPYRNAVAIGIASIGDSDLHGPGVPERVRLARGPAVFGRRSARRSR